MDQSVCKQRDPRRKILITVFYKMLTIKVA